jgi:hypothetical protein
MNPKLGEVMGQLSEAEMEGYWQAHAKAEQFVHELGLISEREGQLRLALQEARKQERAWVESGITRLGIPDGVPFVVEADGTVRKELR